jgi:hypothetical protein
MRFTTLCILALLIAGYSGMAQKVIDITNTDASSMGMGLPVSTIGGEPFANVKFVRVTSGTPFFSENWMKGTLVPTTGSKAYKGLLIRLNLLDNSVNYRDQHGDERVAQTALKFILLTDTTNGAEYSFIHGSQLSLTDKTLQKTWFQVLLNDKVSLCKQLRKSISEPNAYGSATAEQIIDTHPVYFVRMKDDFIPIKKWDELQGLFKDKKDQLTQYIAANHLKGRSEADFIQLVKYYNSLILGQTAKN